jgi:hypothetical protein
MSTPHVYLCANGSCQALANASCQDQGYQLAVFHFLLSVIIEV